MKRTIFILFAMLFTACGKPIEMSGGNGGNETETEVNRKIRITVGGDVFNASLYDNPTVDQFMKLLPMTINMGDLNGNEKYYDLSESLPSAPSKPGRINSGDIMLYGSRTLVIFYESFSSSYSYTKIGVIDDPTGLAEAQGEVVIEKYY